MLTRGDRDWIRRIVREGTQDLEALMVTAVNEIRLARSDAAALHGIELDHDLIDRDAWLDRGAETSEEHPYAWVGEYAAEAVSALLDLFRRKT